MLYSSCLGWWLTYKQLRWMNIFTHWVLVSLTEIAGNAAARAGSLPSLFQQRWIKRCFAVSQAALKPLTQQTLVPCLCSGNDALWVVLSFNCTSLIAAACVPLFLNLLLPKTVLARGSEGSSEVSYGCEAGLCQLLRVIAAEWKCHCYSIK